MEARGAEQRSSRELGTNVQTGQSWWRTADYPDGRMDGRTEEGSSLSTSRSRRLLQGDRPAGRPARGTMVSRAEPGTCRASIQP